MGTSPPRQPDLSDPTGTEGDLAPPTPSRRRFLGRVAVGGAALAVGTQLVPGGGLSPLAGAQDAGGEADPAADLAGDDAIVARMAGISLAASGAYATATAPGTSVVAEPVTEVIRVFGANHNQQAAAFNELLPEGVTIEEPDAALATELQASISRAADQDAVLDALRDLEESIAATQYVAVGTIENINDAEAMINALGVCGQQAVVLGLATDVPAAELVPDLQSGAGAFPLSAGSGASPAGGGETTTTTTAEG